MLTYGETAEKLGVSVDTVRRLVKAHKLRAMRYGYRTVRFRPADVEAFMRSRQTAVDILYR
jgi:excisionase family DNA binding protein